MESSLRKLKQICLIISYTTFQTHAVMGAAILVFYNSKSKTYNLDGPGIMLNMNCTDFGVIQSNV